MFTQSLAASPESIEIGPLRLIAGGNRGRYPFCHSLYVPGAGLLIDPGADRARLEHLRRTEAVRRVWLSHWHEDHWGQLDLFDDLPLAMSRIDAPPLADLAVFLEWYGVGESLYEVWRPLMEEQFHFRPRIPAAYLSDGQVIDLGGLTVEVIHSPGHTPGHLCFFFREIETLFLGDLDLTRFGPWYGDRDSDIEAIIRSVDRLRRIPARRWICSHEKAVYHDLDEALWDAYLAVIERREQAVCAYLEAGPRTLDEIADRWIVYGKPREPKDFYACGERNHMEKHLERLMKAGTVGCENGRYFLRQNR
jgi:glyoxylase-like metal-dependent hydrolase (beta-lactamase superfamily II)